MENWIFSIFPNETFVDLGLYQFGWEKCNPSHSFCLLYTSDAADE